MCFSPNLGVWWGGGGGCGKAVSPKGLVHNLLVQFFTQGSSPNQIFQFFFDLGTTQNDHPRYVKHV